MFPLKKEATNVKGIREPSSMPLLRLKSPEHEISAEVGEFMHDDAQKLLCSFKTAYEKVLSKMKRPHVLIAGTTGTGKR